MARIAGVDLPAKKRAEIGLTYIYGIGRTRSLSLLHRAGVDANKKVADLTEDCRFGANGRIPMPVRARVHGAPPSPARRSRQPKRKRTP